MIRLRSVTSSSFVSNCSGALLFRRRLPGSVYSFNGVPTVRFSKILLFFFVCLGLTAPAVVFGQATITALYFPNAVAGGGGTGATGYPYAVYVRIHDWTACSGGQAFLKIYSSTNNEYMWSANRAWSKTSSPYSGDNEPAIDIDAHGNWSGWIYAKHNNALGTSASIRAAKVGSTSTNLTSQSRTFDVLTTTSTGNGGWIVQASSPGVDKGILAYAGSAVVGSYRTENNDIDEGYPYGPGGFKVAVPAGLVDSLVTIDEDGLRDQVFVGPWAITAGKETDAGVGNTQVGKGSASVQPGTLAGWRSQTLTLTIDGEFPYAIRNVRVVLPAHWDWSHQPGALTLIGPGAPTTSVAGDTVAISGMSLQGSENLQVRISDITPVDTTAWFAVNVHTGASPDSVYPISVQPHIFVYSTPLPISVVKQNDSTGVPLRNNKLVTVRGVVTEAGQFGNVCYMQDDSAGLSVFDSSFATAVTIGDEVIVSGLVQPLSGLTEIVNPMMHTIVSTGNTVDPILATASQIVHDGTDGVEVFEGRLIRINAVTVPGSSAWAGNTDYPLVDHTDTMQLRIDKNTDLPGVPVPASSFNVIGVVGQFISRPPYIGGYQILPRSRSDILSSGSLFVSLPVESDILPNSLTVTWETLNLGTSRLRFGRTPALELGVVGNDVLQTSHSIEISGLDPATFYYIKAFCVFGKDTSVAPTLISSTASPSRTTGQMNAYFNRSMDTTLAWFQSANGDQDLVLRLLARIRGAHRSVDAAMFSLSGTPGEDIARELIAAWSRGVSVRVICEYDNSYSNAILTLKTNGIPIIDDRFDSVNAGAGLMHNKFVIVDGRGGAQESVWVWTGSWDMTDAGTYDDCQNVVEIQDVALAGAFTAEFNEMWGGPTEVPNAADSRFGASAMDDTPHRFVIGGRNVECYFGPSDRTTSRIISAVDAAQHSVAFDLLTLTDTDIAGALVARKQMGVKVRGVLDNNTDSGTQYPYLVANGIDVRLKTSLTGLIHHKYCIIDAEDPSWSPVTITGSHNWTSPAENCNNDNTVMIKDGNIANQFLQEFAARYYEFGGADTINVSVRRVDAIVPMLFSLSQNYPNPYNPVTMIAFAIPIETKVSLKLYNVLGEEIRLLIEDVVSPGDYTVVFNAKDLPSGVYLYRLIAGSYVETRKMLLLK